MDKKKIWYIVISILIPVFIGFLGILLGGSMSLFDNIKKPVFAPSAILFPMHGEYFIYLWEYHRI